MCIRDRSLHHDSDGALLWIGFNAYSDALEFALPTPASSWRCVINTGLGPADDFPATPTPCEGTSLELSSRSLVLLLAEQLTEDLNF